VAGVLEVVEVPSGVAVIADTTWAAMRGRDALACQWDDAAQTRLDSEKISRMLHDRARLAGALARNDGDVPGALGRAAKTLDVSYEVPFLAHAPMEPMNCTAVVTADGCEIWAPNQWPDWARNDAAAAIGLPPEKVTLHVTLMGGGFGRRLLPDYVVEAALVAKAVAGTPVQLVWSREDDMQHGWFRPASVHRMQGGIDKLGHPVAFQHRVIAPSINEQRWPGSVQNGNDADATEGARDMPYAIPNVRVEYGMLQTAVPASWWRSVYTSQTVFASECFIDELAQLAGVDPIVYRRRLLKASPRHLAVLDVAEKESGWHTPLPKGHARGIALNRFWSDTIVAEVAEVSIEQGKVRVHRVVCAVDCGMPISPDGVKAQLEGGVMYGLSAALLGAITVGGGRIQQSNFHDYKVMRMPQAPVIEVHLLPSTDGPKGVGEPGVPPIAPAVANAVSKLTGTRVRKLPITV
jgi:isoquinoline 1-oxidoreductase beta subunit